MIAEQFIERLEQQGLLDAKIVSKLRGQLSKDQKGKLTAEKIAKYLVEKGHLTKYQAIKLVGEIEKAIEGTESPKGKAESGPRELSVTRELGAPGGDDELGFAPSDDGIDMDATPPSGIVDDIVELEDATSAAADTGQLTALEDEPVVAKRPETKPAAAPEEEPVAAAEPPAAPPLEPTPPPSGPEQLDDLLGGGGLDDFDHEHSSLHPERKRTAFAGAAIQSSQWDSKLLLIGGTALGILLIIGGFLYFSLTRGSADQWFEEAEQAYRDGSYTESIKRFVRFRDKFPGNQHVSQASVRIGTARLRQAYSTSSQGLKVAKEVLPEIETEEAFPEYGRPELTSMLPAIAEGFVESAIAARDISTKVDLLKLTREAMELVDNPAYIPTNAKRSQLPRIEAITENMARVQREIDRDRDLTDAIRSIASAVSNGQTQDAYRIRFELIIKYPGLETNEGLVQAIRDVTEKERSAVTVGPATIAPVADDRPNQTEARVVLASGADPVESPTQVLYSLARGTVYALDGNNGAVLWSRTVGHETRFHPVPASIRNPLADAIAVDGRHNELVRFDAKTGRSVWRLPIGEPFADPLVMDDDIFVAAQSGKIYKVDPLTGDTSRMAQLPQPVGISPGFGNRKPNLYVVGEHDNVYLLSRDTLECVEVYYTGHSSGSIAVPPTMTLGYLFISENFGPNISRVHVLSGDADGEKLKPVQKAVQLRGHILVPPATTTRRVLLVTDRRQVVLLDIDPNNEGGAAVTQAAALEATASEPMISYALYSDTGYLWIADDQFTKYQVQVSRGAMPIEWNKADPDVFIAPLQSFGSVLYSVRRTPGSPGVTISALEFSEREARWQTQLADRIVYLRVTDDGIECMTSRGKLYLVDQAALAAGYVGKPVASAQTHKTLSLNNTFSFSEDLVVFSGDEGYEEVVAYRINNSNDPLRVVNLRGAAGTTTAPPLQFAGGLVVPLEEGQLALIDPQTGNELAHAFHPAVAAGSTTRWQRGDLVGDGSEFIVADNHNQIYRIGIKPSPQRHLDQIAVGLLQNPLMRPLVVAGDTVYGITRVGAGDVVIAISADDLSMGKEWALEGRVTWGPARAGDLALIGTDIELLGLEAGQNQRWVLPLEHGALVGQPLVLGSDILVATVTGTVLRIDGATGKITGQAEVGESLAGGPVAYGDRLIVPGADGSILVVPIP